MAKTAIHAEIDALTTALADRGINLKRSDVIEAVAKARGHRNAHEMMANARPTSDIVETSDEHHPFAATEAEADPDLKAQLELREIEVAELRQNLERMERMSFFDWPSWNKTIKGLKKHSHHKKEPISDDDLLLFRLAVTDNTCKSSASERSSAEYMVMDLARKRGAAILARLDRAEELAGLGEKMEGPLLDKMATLYEVTATRDGDTFQEYFFVQDDEDPDTVGTLLAAKSFSIEDLHTLIPDGGDLDAEGRAEELRGDMDTFRTEEASISLPISKVINALKRGEGSVIMHTEIMRMAGQMDIDPRGTKSYIYPTMEG